MTLYATAERKSRYGRNEWLFWRDARGAEHIAPKSRANLKTALLACGTKGRFTLLIGGIGHRVNWRMGTMMFRNARFHETH